MGFKPTTTVSGLSYKGSTIVNSGLSVVIWGTFKSSTTLESYLTIVEPLLDDKWARSFLWNFYDAEAASGHVTSEEKFASFDCPQKRAIDRDLLEEKKNIF